MREEDKDMRLCGTDTSFLLENRVNREIRETRERRKLPGESSGYFAYFA